MKINAKRTESERMNRILEYYGGYSLRTKLDTN